MNEFTTHGRGSLSGTDESDVLTGIAADNGTRQIHVWAKNGKDTINLDFDIITSYSMGHHARGEKKVPREFDSDTFNFQNLSNIGDIVVGRIEDFDPSRDEIQIEGSAISLQELERGFGTTAGVSWRVVEYDADTRDSLDAKQQWLLIDSGQGYAFYALEGARVTQPWDGAANGGHQEAHFVGANNGHLVTTAELASLSTVGYVDPVDYIPAGYTAQGGWTISDQDSYYFDSTDIIRGSVRGDLIAAGLNDDQVRANEGNDVVWGGSGNDLVDGGRDEDTLFGGTGADKLLGGEGKDVLYGDTGADFLYGGAGADVLYGGSGKDRATYATETPGARADLEFAHVTADDFMF